MTPDFEGKLTENLIERFHTNKNVNHEVSLLSLECSSLFSNILKDKNDKFFYSITLGSAKNTGVSLSRPAPYAPADIKEITIATGATESMSWDYK